MQGLRLDVLRAAAMEVLWGSVFHMTRHMTFRPPFRQGSVWLQLV